MGGRGRVERRQPVGRQREEAFHVGGAAGCVAALDLGESEWVGPPVRLQGRHHVHVTREDQAGAIAPLRAGPDDQVGLLPISGEVPVDPDAGALQVVGQEIDQRQVAQMTGGVEGDQTGEQRPVVQPGMGRGQEPASVASRAIRARISRTPGCSGGSASFHSSAKRR